MRVKCCSCNSSGACKKCACVKLKRRCSNCVPSQLGKCQNFKLPGAEITPGVARSSTESAESISFIQPSLIPTISSSSNFPSASSCPPLVLGPKDSDSLDPHSQVKSTQVRSIQVKRSQVQAIAESSEPCSPAQINTEAGVEMANCTITECDAASHPSLDDFQRECSDYILDNTMATSVMPDLPPFSEGARRDFTWGRLSGEDFAETIHNAYSEMVHWRRNVFLVPTGKVGKQFVKELTRLFNAYAQSSALESVALESIMVACGVLLQKPHEFSKSKDHVIALDRRLNAWRDGDIDGLMREARAIQSQLHMRSRNTRLEEEGANAKIFAKLVFQGKIHSALRFLSDNSGGGILPLDEIVDQTRDYTVRDALREKHPAKRSVSPEVLISTRSREPPPELHPIRFERLTGTTIRSAALRSTGSAGPSGVDAAGWRRLCCSFHKDSSDLCTAIASFAKRISTAFVDPTGLQPFVACRLLPLNKNPGVRPIGVCEVIRRIVGKAILSVVGTDVVQAAGPLQLCAGQPAGCEVAVHTMRKVFAEASTDAVILVDASNAFNNINRRVALANIQYLCPSIAIILINCYRGNANLFVGKEVILSQEGTTQGDPLAMAFFALASVPLIKAVAVDLSTQVWFADDAACGGVLMRLRQWWDNLCIMGPKYGYFPNAEKTYLIVKPEKEEEASRLFQGTNITICETGKRYLGGALGSNEFALSLTREKVTMWVHDLDRLAKFATTEPHAAFAVLTHGLVSRWMYAIRVAEPSVEDLLKPLETVIRQKIIPALTGQPPPDDTTRKLLALPPRFGGLGISDITAIAKVQQQVSKEVSDPLVNLITEKLDNGEIGGGCLADEIIKATAEQRLAKQRLKRQNEQELKIEAETVVASLPPAQRDCALAAQEKGASSWVGAVPIERVGFALPKGAFKDAIALRYNWTPPLLPQRCTCGETFTVAHALVCRHGGFQIQRHNKLRDIVASLLDEVCSNVATEPQLQPLSGEHLPRSANKEDNARLDVRASGFWGVGEKDAFFDIRVFYPFASSYQGSRLTALYRQQENRKRGEYGQRVRDVEHGYFTPLVFTTGGGMAAEATVFFKRLASLLSEKRNETYSCVMGWLRCVVSFSLLRSSLVCLRGTRVKQNKIDCNSIAEAVAGGRINM